jgi:uncharacterized membrane protein
MTVQDPVQALDVRSGMRPIAGADIGNQLARANSNDRLATFLGVFSIGLGLAEVLAPEALGRAIGLRRPNRILTRIFGFREIAAGIGILSSRHPTNWLRARVAGDALDLAALGWAYRGRSNGKAQLIAAVGSVASVTAADVLCAKRLADTPERQDVEQSDLIRFRKSLAVNRSPEECYRFWRDFANFPQFMKHVESVQVTSDRSSHWKAKITGAPSIEWDAEITRDTAGECIEWRSHQNATVENWGKVRFEPRIQGGGTLVRLEMQYRVPGGKLGAIAAKLHGLIPEQQVYEDLRRFKAVIETGETPTTEGQPSGREVQNP